MFVQNEKKILLLGGTGRLGSAFNFQFKKDNIEYLSPKKDELNLLDRKSIELYLSKTKPSFIINCAGLSILDICEREKEKSRILNFELIKILNIYSTETKAILLTFSTDYVFDGLSSPDHSYSETDEKKPLSIYGSHKSDMEDYLLTEGKNFFIIRISSLYGVGINNFVFKGLKNLIQKKGETIEIVDDEFISPSLNLDVASFSIFLLNQNNKNYGCYNFFSYEGCYRYDFFMKLKQNFITFLETYNFAYKDINPIKTSRLFFESSSLRPKNSSLNCRKLESNDNYLNFIQFKRENELIFFRHLLKDDLKI